MMYLIDRHTAVHYASYSGVNNLDVLDVLTNVLRIPPWCTAGAVCRNTLKGPPPGK